MVAALHGPGIPTHRIIEKLASLHHVNIIAAIGIAKHLAFEVQSLDSDATAASLTHCSMNGYLILHTFLPHKFWILKKRMFVLIL